MNSRVKELFHELAELPEEARARYFAEHELDLETRREVEELLAFDSGASEFLIHDVSVAASRSLPHLDPKGWRCGPYRLLNVIGRGGMGAVYLAERADGEVTQRVAVKLLPPGAGNVQQERFLQERQILASLTHPNIAHMLDAGHVENGQPFLAMEYVEGKPIDVFAAGLSSRQKITLFLKVCAAVSHLHRSLVVHRDLKPSNILVTAEGEPKLLDFGIAKMLDMATDSTQTSMRMLTPDYASPEQVMGGRVSTATDIYSLGGVLYKLLTGKAPHEFEDNSPEAIANVITSREVTRPSTWAAELKGDLDFILLKALRKEPLDRYATVEQLSEELQAFIESRPVKARSGNAWYRTRKFLRRYWLPVTAASMVIASLALGLYVANRERTIAQRRFNQVRQLANKVLALDGTIYQLPGSTKARQEIVAMSQEYLEGLRVEASRDQDLAVEIAEAYDRLARAQGVPVRPNLGQYAEAGESLRKAHSLLDSVLRASPRNRRALLQWANVAHDRMILANNAHRNDDALAQARRAAARLDALVNLGELSQRESAVATALYSDIALLHKNLHLYDDSVRYARRAIDLAPSTSGRGSVVSQPLSVLADSLRFSGDLEGALRAIQEARAATESATFEGERERRTNTSNVLWREGVILGQDGNISLERPAEAAAALKRALDLNEEWAQKDSNDASSRILIAMAARELGPILRHTDPARALAVFDHALLRLAEIKNINPSARNDQIRLLAYSSYPLRTLHRQGEAQERIDKAFQLLREAKQYPTERINPSDEADAALRALGDHLAETSQPQRAAEVYQELLDKTMAFKPDPQNDLPNVFKLSRTYEALAALDRRNGRPEEAAALDARRLEIWKYWQTKLPNSPYVLRLLAAAQAR